MTIVKREGLSRPLTWGELDGNFDAVEALRTEAAQAVAQSGANANASAASAGVAESARDDALNAAAQVEADLVRVIKAPEGEVLGELPVTGDRNDTLLGFGSNGQPVVHPVADFVQYDEDGNVPVTPDMIRSTVGKLYKINSEAVAISDNVGSLDGIQAIYHPESAMTWLIPVITGETVVSFNPPMLVTDTQNIDLTQFNVDRENFQQRPQYNFDDGFTLRNGLETVNYEGVEYQWDGAFPKVVAAGSAPVDSRWVVVGGAQVIQWRNDKDARGWGVIPIEDIDNTQAFIRFLNDTQNEPEIKLPPGVISVGDIGNIRRKNQRWVGSGGLGTILKSINSVQDHTAFSFDAFASGSASDPFVEGFSLEGIHFEGNEKTLTTVRMQGIARGKIRDVSAWGCKNNLGTIFDIRGCMSNTFDGFYVSRNKRRAHLSANTPLVDLILTQGSRAGSSVGACSNNVFIQMMLEGGGRGLNMIFADQNTFIGGASQGQTDYGVNIQAACRYNTFIGFGTESINAQTADIIDAGIYTKFLNCYSSNRFVLRGKSAEVSGGYFERLEIQDSAQLNEVHGITVNHWNTGSGGLVNNSSSSIVYSVTDSISQSLLNCTDIRRTATLITTEVSGGTVGKWTNSTFLPVQFYIVGASTFTAARLYRLGDYVDISLDARQSIHIEAGDTVELTWSTTTTTPSCSYRVMRGYN